MALYLITAPSGAGKTSVMQVVAKTLGQDELREVISDTTRKPRVGEVNGVTYYYRTVEDFLKRNQEGEYIETVGYDMNWYGISKEEIEFKKAMATNQYIIVEYDGYKQIKEQYPEAVGIFISVTREDCLSNMIARGDSPENILKRIYTYEEEMKNKGEFDYVIQNQNGNMDLTVNLIMNIIQNRI